MEYTSHDPWAGVTFDLVALREIVCKVFRVPITQCGSPVQIDAQYEMTYARVYSFKLPSRIVVARLVAPVKPLFKTENEVAAMDFVRRHTSLPVAKVFAYCSEASNPVGVEWVIMEYMPGVKMCDAWDDLQLPQKRRLALDVIDLLDQLSRLKSGGCGGIYHRVGSVDDFDILISSAPDVFEVQHTRSLRWTPLSAESLRVLQRQCNYATHDVYKLGPLNDISLIDFYQTVPSSSRTLPVFTTEEYVKLVAFNGNPSTRSRYDYPTREKCVELFQSISKLYPNSTMFGPSEVEPSNFRFAHGDLHGGNVLIDPKSGVITGIIDWESAAFRPLWSEACGIDWLDEDGERFLFGEDPPENFDGDTGPDDAKLRAFFRTEMYKRNPDLFSAFLGGIELRAVLHAAGDIPPPRGRSEVFLDFYHELGFWNESRRGPFPWDMKAWLRRQVDMGLVCDTLEFQVKQLKLSQEKMAAEAKMKGQ